MGSLGPFALVRVLDGGRVRHFLSKYKRIHFFAESFAHPGFKVFLIIRLVGLPPFGIVNYLAGLSGMSWKVYCGATLLGILPWMVGYTYFADVLWKIFRTAGMNGFQKAITEHALPLICLGTLFLGLIALTLFLKKRQAKK
jgi:uncharacterized membrane protein YdjX (TVP38/TMEM64 family)